MTLSLLDAIGLPLGSDSSLSVFGLKVDFRMSAKLSSSESDELSGGRLTFSSASSFVRGLFISGVRLVAEAPDSIFEGNKVGGAMFWCRD